MTSIALETGNIVHDCIKVLLERLLLNESAINEDKFLDYSYRKTKEYVLSKKFAEIFYGEITNDECSPDIIFEKVKKNLLNFIHSERYLWVVQKAITNKKHWVIEPAGFGEARINNMKVYCKVDFLFPVEDKIYILDWKTGKQDEKKHKKQLIGYSAWASYHFDKSPDFIFPMTAYLYPDYNEMHVQINEFDIHEFINSVQSETNEMYSFCRNVEKNMPKNKDEFLKTSNKFICKYCNYKELCK